MIYFIIHILISVVILFISWKKWSVGFLEKKGTTYKDEWGDLCQLVWVQIPEFWYISLAFLFWPILGPLVLVWFLLEYLIGKTVEEKFKTNK